MFTFTLIDMWTSVLRMRNESYNGRGLLPIRAKAKLPPVIEYLTSLFDVNDNVIFHLHFTSIAVNKLLL